MNTKVFILRGDRYQLHFTGTVRRLHGNLNACHYFHINYILSELNNTNYKPVTWSIMPSVL
jgi:hypothetical protein